MRPALLLCLALGCAGPPAVTAPRDASLDTAATDVGTDAGPKVPEVAEAPRLVPVTFRIVDAVTRRGVTGRLDPGTGAGPTDLERGEATLELPAGQAFEVVLTASGYAPMHLHGLAAEGDFTLVSFAASQAVTRTVLRALGLADDPNTALVVAGLDTPQLRPAVGAGARVAGVAAPGFLFDATGMPRAGNTLVAGGASFVTLPGVPPGEANLEVTAPPGQRCAFREDGGDTVGFTARAGAVHVLSFICTGISR